MITPEYVEYALDILQVHKELQESIIRDIVRRMLTHLARLTDTAEWQIEKVQQSGILYNELVRELSRATGRLESEIRAAFDDAEGKIFDYGDKTGRLFLKQARTGSASPRLPLLRCSHHTYAPATLRICRLQAAHLTTTRQFATRSNMPRGRA